MDTKKKIIVVSNRLPAVICQEEGQWRIVPASGGLVTALAPFLKKCHGTWIGWSGAGDEAPVGELLDQFGREHDYSLVGVPLNTGEIDGYYWGFSNRVIWPLFHDLLGYCDFKLENWQTYKEVNRKFAEIIAGSVDKNCFIWIHDYHFTLVAQYLRKIGVDLPLVYFQHIPFPSPDMIRRLPWKKEVIRGMLAYDNVCFQTLRDRRNFVNSALSLFPGEIEVASRSGHYTLLDYSNRTIKANNIPISIDFKQFNDLAHTKEVEESAWYLHEHFGSRQMVLGIDRLDYTKGIPERLLAFERALEKYPDLVQNISLLQILVPSRVNDKHYMGLKKQLDEMVGRINSRFASPAWIPVHYIYHSLDLTELIAHYRTSEIALITPLRDGMNLVAKEYCACSVENNGVLILSEFAGAADQLGQMALLVNPYDIEKTADAINQAYHMPIEERQFRMHWLRSQVKRNDVHKWVRLNFEFSGQKQPETVD